MFKKSAPRQTPSSVGALLSAGLYTILIAAILVGLIWIMEAQTLATRAATALAMPIGIACLLSLMFSFWFLKLRQWMAAIAFFALFLAIWIPANPYVAARQMNSVEWPEVQLTAATKEKPLRVAIVLGGGASISPKGMIEVNRDGDRLLTGAQLWHDGLTSAIICTGETPDGNYNPSKVGKELLVSLGVPADVIYETGGEVTSQEMIELKTFFADPPNEFPSEGAIALVTSPFHMRRAMRLAKGQHLNLEPVPCGYRGRDIEKFVPSLLIPSAECANDFGFALKEQLAGLVGR